MKNRILTLVLSALLIISLAACNSKPETPESSTPTDTQSLSATLPDDSQSDAADLQNTDESNGSEPVTSTPGGDIADGTLATKENPVPFGTWASVTVTDGGWPKPAYARLSNVITDQTQVQALIDEYDNKHSGKELLALEEHAEFLDYVVVEYEVFFPADFSTSDSITFYGLVFSRNNNQDDWIASDGSNYYWMGSVTTLNETMRPKNGDTVKCSIIYPMIKGNTDYTLFYKERTEDLSATIETYFAVE